MKIDKELIQDAIDSARKGVVYFSNSEKHTREKWVVCEFLKNLGVDFNDSELYPISDVVPDVRFRDARFEIKEIDDENRKRHDEYKTRLERALSAQTSTGLMEVYRPKKIDMLGILDRVRKNLGSLRYDPKFIAQNDLLYYINYTFKSGRKCVHMLSKEMLLRGWRSVSIVTNNSISYVLWANRNAPEFMRLNLNKCCNYTSSRSRIESTPFSVSGKVL